MLCIPGTIISKYIMQSFFILGSNPTLSLAELSAVLGHDKDYSQASSEIVLIDNLDKNLGDLQDRLAGIIKCGDLIGSMSEINNQELVDLISAFCLDTEGRINFGISVYDLGNPQLAKTLRKQMKNIGLSVKKELRNQGKPVRFVTSKEPQLSSVILVTNHLLESGGEFVLIATKQGILIGQTRAVQDFQAWAKRDMKKPRRDPKRGMLPPKLARTMINLGSPRAASRGPFLDPFCGVGTTLIEAVLLGFNPIIGSDIDERAVADTEKNINWLERELDITLPETRLETSPAEDLTETLTDTKVNLVSTEPLLGPLQTGRETTQEIKDTINDLTSLYIESFQEITKLLEKDATVVVVLPVFSINAHETYIPVIKEFEQFGLHVVDPIPESAPKQLNKKTPRNGILYFRPKQFISREVLIFRYSP
jgi:tRNA G10  N-methylase Trm11